MCNDTHRRACAVQRKLYELLEILGFMFNEKRTPQVQRGEFIWLGWDTLKGVFWMSERKANSLEEKVADILGKAQP